MPLHAGSLITIPLHFTDLTAVKRRPALILIVQGEDLVVCGVTSKVSRRRDAVPLDHRGMAEGRLPAQSEVRPLKLFTIHRALIHTRVGRVSDNTFRRVVALPTSSSHRGRGPAD